MSEITQPHPEISTRSTTKSNLCPLCFQSSAVKRLIPLLDRVLVQRFEAVTTTKGGIVIPEKAQAKVLHAQVVAVGPGGRNKNGDHIPPSVQPGDTVLLPEFGGTKVTLEDNTEYQLFREQDILARIEVQEEPKKKK